MLCQIKVSFYSIKIFDSSFTNFKSNFPVIETLEISTVKAVDLNSHLETIISSKTLKCLQIDYFSDKKYTLKFKKELKSSIEELKLTKITWEFVSGFLKVERFPCLKKLDIEISNRYSNFEDVLKTLSSFPQLTSLTLRGDFRFSSENLSFRFENLKFFCFDSFQNTIDLDLLLSCMPNLIELQLKEWTLRELKLQNTIGIRYLQLSYYVLRDNGDYINVIKNTPNLIQLTTKKPEFSPIRSIPYDSELAYYFKELKKHFNSKLQFKINPNCYPIKQLKRDVKLVKLLRLKSSELPNYLNENFPIDPFKSFVEQIFKIDIEKYFNVESIDYGLVKRFFNLISELKVDGEENVLFVKKLLLEGEKEYFTESTDFSLDNFYQVFTDYLTNSIEAKLKSVHLEFIEKFFKANRNYGLLKIFSFLESFFSSLSISNGESKIINDEIFTFFAEPLLISSFGSLFDKIKENNVDLFSFLSNGIKGSEEEKKSLSLELKFIAKELKILEPEQFNGLSAHFKDLLMEFYNGSFIESFSDTLHAILIPRTECVICLESLFTKEYKFSKGKDGNCHLFHNDCLEEWLKENDTCPQCMRIFFDFNE